jgi:hypothetical protein
MNSYDALSVRLSNDGVPNTVAEASNIMTISSAFLIIVWGIINGAWKALVRNDT